MSIISHREYITDDVRPAIFRVRILLYIHYGEVADEERSCLIVLLHCLTPSLCWRSM